MRFAAVIREIMRSPAFASASARAVGGWVRGYSYAAEIERGGRVPGAAGWTDDQWRAIAQVKLADVRQAIKEGLLVEDGADVVVVGYDMDGERKVQTARENGRKPPREGKHRGRPSGKPKQNPSVSLGVSEAKPDRKPLSGSGSDPSPGGGGEDPAAAALETFRTARSGAKAAGKQVTFDESDLPELAARVRQLPEPQRGLLAKVIERFFARDGKDRTDTHWRDREWSPHIFATQALDRLLPEAEAEARQPGRQPVERQPEEAPAPWTEEQKAEAAQLRRSLRGAA